MESQGNRLWAGEKNCDICGVALGHGLLKEPKLYCVLCSHAICGKCVAPKTASSSRTRKRTCKRCGESLQYNPRPHTMRIPDDFSQADPMQQSFRSERSMTYDSIADMSGLRDADDSGLLDNVMSSARVLSASMMHYAGTSPTDVEKSALEYNHTLMKKHEEVQSLKEKEKWYSDKLKSKDSEIQDLSAQVEALKDISSDLQTKIKQMEEKIVQPQTARSSEVCFCCRRDDCSIQ